MRFYPLVRCENLLDVDSLDLGDFRTMSLVRDLIIQNAENPSAGWSTNRFQRCLSRPYEVAEPSRYQLFRLAEFWNALAAPNYVLLRGMYALIKADMLSCHYEFLEEAIVSLYISLEASFALIARRLKDEGIASPTAHDAAIWLHCHFDSPFGLPKPGSNGEVFSRILRTEDYDSASREPIWRLALRTNHA